MRVALLARHLPDLHLRHLAFAARRDNPTAFLHTLSDVQCSLFLVLLALNRTWFPTWKWLYDAIDRMAVVPPGTPARLRSMFTMPPTDAVDRLREVLNDTIALVEVHATGVDPAVIATTRRGIDQHPASCEPTQ